MNLGKALRTISLSITGLLLLLGLVTVGALYEFSAAQKASHTRQRSVELVTDLRAEVDLLGRLISSYVSTANPRFLIYYYDILAIREGKKNQQNPNQANDWESVIAGVQPYVPALEVQGVSLSMRATQEGFQGEEKQALHDIFAIAEQMKSVEQVAFAATQGLYDPDLLDFVSETRPRPDYAIQLLHETKYLKLRAELQGALDRLEKRVDMRTAQAMASAEKALQYAILGALALLAGCALALMGSYRYLVKHLIFPLSMLHRTALALGDKVYSQRVGPLQGVAEVQALAQTVDEMAAAIENDIAQREVIQAQLHEARERAEVATQAKSMFLANMSHEIRTPMNAILGMAYLALNSDLPPKQQDYIEKIHRAAQSLLNIINDVLDLSKIEAGKIDIESTSFDLEDVLKNALFMVQQRAESKGLELVLDFSPQTIAHQLVGDPLRLGQVLINLLGNAVKFTDQGHVRLVAQALDQIDGALHVNFRIEDSGIGMTPKQLERLFQEYSQAEDSTARKYGGTGLGLSISKRLVLAMGDDIQVTSQAGVGSCFSFTLMLPISDASVNSKDDDQPICQRALVVDDYDLARESMAGLLQSLGCPEVDQVSTGQGVLDALAQAQAQGRSYDVLLLDWHLPDLMGDEVLDRVQIQSLVLPPITLIVSGLDATLLRCELCAGQVSALIQKPLFPSALRSAMKSARAQLRAQQNAALIEPASVTETVEALTEAPPPSLSGRILLVEDEPINREIAFEIVSSWGLTVEMVENGLQAIELLRSKPDGCYDLVLMDLEMPVMDGRDAVRHLRADPRFTRLPILCMSAHAEGDTNLEWIELGMNGYVPKPFDPDYLRNKLALYLPQEMKLLQISEFNSVE